MLIPGNQLETISRALNLRTLLVLVPLLLLLAAACSSDSEDPIISSEQEAGGPEYSGTIITTDLAVGVNRLLFGVVDRKGMPVIGDSADVGVFFLVPREDARELRQQVTADFISWPTVIGGVFGAEVDIPLGGVYELDIRYTSSDGVEVFAQTSFLVKDESETPSVGSPAPTSVTHTLADAEEISHITSSSEPDPELYQLSIDEALSEHKPLVIVFATPAFCVSATCGPQVGEITKVKAIVGDQANFIHVEVFEDPHLIENSRHAGQLVPAVLEWGLPTEPWVFIVDKDGLVSAKFEQFTTAGEIEAKLLEIL
ncbi:MAG TPA: hypothetical protein EYG27_10825 [Dehalococcoidia bacterium]|jgi:hypothetical protein|nr:hypothetical protein [Dehalococcoidia bacterium]HIL32011.1 hypothetical protein [Dehalococcoidia bacterium]